MPAIAAGDVPEHHHPADLRLKVTEAGSTAIELRGAGDERIRVATLDFASEERLQECLAELRRRLAAIDEERVW